MENELDHLKEQLKAINNDLYYFWEDHQLESDPHKILVLWGRLQYMMGMKMSIEMSIERIEEELNNGRK